MGCIEINICRRHLLKCPSLIETWDVLKFAFIRLVSFAFVSLIETWDVLKFNTILITQPRKGSLIETWDVLKCVYGY